jgi:hypothetical protein
MYSWCLTWIVLAVLGGSWDQVGVPARWSASGTRLGFGGRDPTDHVHPNGRLPISMGIGLVGVSAGIHGSCPSQRSPSGVEGCWVGRCPSAMVGEPPHVRALSAVRFARRGGVRLLFCLLGSMLEGGGRCLVMSFFGGVEIQRVVPVPPVVLRVLASVVSCRQVWFEEPGLGESCPSEWLFSVSR